jgi:hypothetical protein
MRGSRAVVVAVVMAGCLPNFPDSQTQGTTGVGGGGATGGDDGGTVAGGGGTSTTDMASGGGGGGGGSVDMATGGGGGGGAADMAGGGGTTDMASNCIALTTALTSGHHNAGAACAGCHNGSGATLWTASGTLYNAVSGGAAIAGATIVLTDANNQAVSIVTSTNGNFYTTTPLTYPVTARASGCPNDVAMVSKASSGDCNSCHNSTLRVHLP